MKNSYDIILALECMTGLRYFMPILKSIMSIDPSINLAIFTKSSGKYNCPARSIDKIRAIVRKIANKDIEINVIPNSAMSTKINTNIIFSVEAVPFVDNNFIFNYKKKYCIQHGTDYWNFAKKADNLTTYLMSSELYGNDLKRYNSKAETINCEVPIVYWHFNEETINFNKKDKRICLFYPEYGHHSDVYSLINKIDDDFLVYIKQRRKNQAPHASLNNLKNRVMVVYDDMWYPSEAVYLPWASNISVGFGTSAYIDIVAMGLNFIDYPLHPKTKDYPKPTGSSNYKLVNNHSELVEAIKMFDKLGYPRIVKSSYNPLEFVYNLINYEG